MAILLLVLANYTIAQENDLGVTLDAKIASKYIWRGFDIYEDDASVFQPSITLDLYGTGLGLKVLSSRANMGKYENEEELLSKLSSVLPEKDIQRSLDTLIGTQKVRRIGPEIIQNNTSHTELPELPNNIKELLDKI